MKHAIVSKSDLGTDCWSVARFLGGNCQRMLRCKYDCKKTCKAHHDDSDFTVTTTRHHPDGRVEVVRRGKRRRGQ